MCGGRRRGGKEERNEFLKMGGRIANGEGEGKERVKGERREEVRAHRGAPYLWCTIIGVCPLHHPIPVALEHPHLGPLHWQGGRSLCRVRGGG